MALAFGGLVSCITSQGGAGDYDRRTMSIEFFNIFNQRLPETPENLWRGDWFFRRMRLAKIDESIRNARPDVLVLEGAMNRYASIVESDDEILGSGALKGYAWDVIKINDYEDSFETENHMIAVGLPLTIKRDIPSVDRVWKLNDKSFFSLSIIELEEQPLAIFSVEMQNEADAPNFFNELAATYGKTLQTVPGLCRERVVILGRVNNLPSHRLFRDWLEHNGMKDASAGFCENASQCYTAEVANELFSITEPQLPSGQYDRFYVPATANIYSSRRTQSLASPIESESLKAFGLNQLWTTAHYGWNVTMRLRRCPPSS